MGIGDYPASVEEPVSYPRSTYDIDRKVREYMEWLLFELRAAGLEDLASPSGDQGKVIFRLENEIRPTLQDFYRAAARDAGAYKQWRKGMEVYDVHPATTASLMKMGSKAKIPGSIFRRLRHVNPFIAIPGGVPITYADGRPGRIFGFYVSGAISGTYPLPTGIRASNPAALKARGRTAMLVDTHHAAANALKVSIISEVLDQPEENSVDIDVCHLTLPMTKDFTLEGLIEEITSTGFSWATPVQRQEKNEKPYLVTMARAAVSHLLYACSRTVEIADPPAAKRPVGKKKKGPVKASKQPSKIYPVGYRMGAAIEDSMRRAEQARETGEPTGRKMPPHIRAPHAHLYWVGPGRQEAEIKVLDAIPVNIPDTAPDVTTIHPVK